MQPNDDRHVAVPSRDGGQPIQKPDRDLAVALMREQINRLYDNDQSVAAQPGPSITQPIPQKMTAATNPVPNQPEPVVDQPSRFQPTQPSAYHHEHDKAAEHTISRDESAEWTKYHSAWQQYYQQYYERYYLNQQYAAKQQTNKPTASTVASSSQFPQTAPTDNAATKTTGVNRHDALTDIKNDLTSRISDRAKKVRKSRHFIPIISGLAVMVVFLFLQYNRLVFAQVKAYVSPGSINPQNIILDESSNTKVSQEPRIVIPKINVDAPVVYGLTTLDEGPVQSALRNGVIHYPIPGASANPGEKGNSVFLGHSSNDVFDDGGYKFVFVQLESLQAGDKFYLNYKGTRYTYRVTSTETILPTQIEKLQVNSENPTATLVTCTPVGTAQKRFLVHAEQISPDPAKATETSSADNSDSHPTNITGNSPTLFERLFGQ